MWELDYKESWAPKNWCFLTVVLEKTLESPLESKDIKPVNPKGNQSWIFIGRNDAEAPILWPPDVKNWLIRKDPDGGKNRGWDGWMASLTRWTWVWVSSGSWWWTGKPGVLQSMGPQSWTWLSDWTEVIEENNSKKKKKKTATGSTAIAPVLFLRQMIWLFSLYLSVVVGWWLPKDISTQTLRMSSYLEWGSLQI